MTNPSPTEITRQYARWFDSQIDRFADQHRGRFQSRSAFKSQNGFFITISFEHNGSESRSELDRFSALYNKVCRQVLGRNYHRRSHDHERPLAIGCLDSNGSRYWRQLGQVENAHIHSIWMLTNQIAPAFRNLVADKNWLQGFEKQLSIRQIDIQPFDDRDRYSTGESRIASYTAKFVGFNNAELAVADDVCVLPPQRT